MATTPTTSTTSNAAAAAQAATNSATATGRKRLADNFDTFLSLLTTQMKNQDPLSPMDSNQFTQQLTQMTGVEQQLLTNDLLQKLVANTGTGVATAVSLIGKDVRADTADAGLKDGKATWTYNFARAASDVKLDILDSKGVVVRSIAPTDNAAGDHTFVWDGKSAAGTAMASGTYTLRVSATDSQGTAVTTKIFSDGLVTGVEQKDGATLISVNGAQVAWDKIVSIRQPATNTAANTNTVNTTSNTNQPAA